MVEFWLNNPNILLNKDFISEIFPSKDFSLAQKLNAITRLIILLTILGYLFTRSIKIVVSAVISLIVLVIIYKSKAEKEDFSVIKKEEPIKVVKNEKKNYIEEKFTTPTKKNPMMNVLIDEYKYNKDRPPAAPSYNNQIKKEMYENAKSENKKLYRNLGDSILYENSLQNFYTMPNTKIPNNQKDFAMFCYGNMPSCKEGDELQCTKNNAGLRTS